MTNLLFSTNESNIKWEQKGSPSYLQDLNLNDVFNAILSGEQNFPINFLKHPCLHSEDAEYRLETMREIHGSNVLFENINEINSVLREMQSKCSNINNYTNDLQKAGCFLDLILKYDNAAGLIKSSINGAVSKSFSRLLSDLNLITSTTWYKIMLEAANHCKRVLNDCLNINIVINSAKKSIIFEKPENTDNITLKLYANIQKCFNVSEACDISLYSSVPISPLEELILNKLVECYPKLFQMMKNFHKDYLNFTNEINALILLAPQFLFYTGYLRFIKNFGNFTMPVFSEGGFSAKNCRDISLLLKNKPCIGNDVNMPFGSISVLSGPNQGGKTTFLRSIGATVHLAKCGCFVPCEKCELPFYDDIYTHFPPKDDSLNGRLKNEADKLNKHMPDFTSKSLLLFNECFSSTRRKDTLEILSHYIAKIRDIGCSALFITHCYELSSIHNNIKALTAGIDHGRNRTYIIKEEENGGLAYARDIAIACGVTFEMLIV